MDQIEELKSDLAAILLADDSPVSSDPAFQRVRQETTELTKQHDQHSTLIGRLEEAFDKVSQSEKACQVADQSLQDARKQLTQFAATLGEAAFAAVQAETIETTPWFQNRQELHDKIDSLKQQKSALSTGDSSGVMEQASLHAQQLKLTGQIKVEELKIHSVNRKLGNDILSAEQEDDFRCSQTESVLGEIQQQRERIEVAKNHLRQAKAKVETSQKQAAENLGDSTTSDAKSLKARLKKEQVALRNVESRQQRLRDDMVEKALEYEWLRDKPELKDLLAQIAQLQQEATPRKLSIWPLALIVIAGYLLSNFGSEPLNLSVWGVTLLYLVTGLGGLGLLAYYKPELASSERRFQSLLLLFAYSIISIIGLLLFQQLADYAVAHWSDRPSWAQGRLILFDIPRMLLVGVGTAYRDTFAIMEGTAVPESFQVYFRNHMLSVGLCEEIVKLSPALVALATFTGAWTSRSKDFNSRLVYLAMIGGLAFGLGEAVHYHFGMYAPMGAGWGIYALRFLSCVTIHAVWAGISGWLLAHVTGGWIRKAFTTAAQGWGLIGGCLIIAATVGVSDVLHTSHNLSNNLLWVASWDIISLALFAWLVRCSNLKQLVPLKVQRLWNRGIDPTDVAATATQFQELASSRLGLSNSNASDTSSAETSSETTHSSQPALWNPNAAGFWSLILTPVFGAWLHAKNWKALGDPTKAKHSMLWVYISAASLVGATLLSAFLPILFRLTYGGLLVAWWLKSGNQQHRYVTEHCPDYQKKTWGPPLCIAGLAMFVLVILSVAWAATSESEQAKSQLIGTWSMHAEASQVIDQDTGTRQHLTFAGKWTFHQDGTSTTLAKATLNLTSQQGEQISYSLQITTQGKWRFDGTTLFETVTECNIAPADATAQSLVENDPTFLTTQQQSMLGGPTAYATTLTTADAFELIDQETGLTIQLTRVPSEQPQPVD